MKLSQIKSQSTCQFDIKAGDIVYYNRTITLTEKTHKLIDPIKKKDKNRT